MERITIPYDTGVLEADLEGFRLLGTLDVATAPPLADLAGTLKHGLDHPRGGSPLHRRLPQGASVLIVVSDSFRKTGSEHFLPPLVHYLNAHGVADPQIAFLFATGSHRPPTPDEQATILGPEVFSRFKDRAMAHNPSDCGNLVTLGTTLRGTPVSIHRRAVEADCVIVTGTVVLHYFGGFGGGRKSIVPGIAGLETIAANHSLNLDPVDNKLNPDVAIGRTAGNPVAEDMLEGARFLPGTFLINTVLNRQGEIAGLFCGELEEAHAAACVFARDLFAVPIEQQADLVIASAGAAKNFVQSHKALYNAFQAMRPGGRIILAAPAREGFGGSRFAKWLALGHRDAIIAELRRNAEINGQTALSTIEKAPQTCFITQLSPLEVQLLGGIKADNLSEALALSRAALARDGVMDPTCYLMPSANHTVPFALAK